MYKKINDNISAYIQESNEKIALLNNDYKQLLPLSKITTDGDDTLVMGKTNSHYFVMEGHEKGQILGRYQGIDDKFNIINEAVNQRDTKQYDLVVMNDDSYHIGLFNTWDYRENVKIGLAVALVLIDKCEDVERISTTLGLNASSLNRVYAYTFFGKLKDGRFISFCSKNYSPLNFRNYIKSQYDLQFLVQLDGGGSTQMQSGTKTVFNPDNQERYIPNAIIYYEDNRKVDNKVIDVDGLKVTFDLIDESKYSLKCPYVMDDEFITIHETDNPNNASARAETNYMQGNDNATSFHAVVDSIEAIVSIPFDRNSWNASDGDGAGNRKSISIEICHNVDYSNDSAKYKQAVNNAVKLVKWLMAERNIPIQNIKQHYDWHPKKKNCPSRMRNEGQWDNFINKIKGDAPVIPDLSKFKVGDEVVCTKYAANSTTNTYTEKTVTATITKILDNGSLNPILLNDGNYGWTNETFLTIKPIVDETQAIKELHIIIDNLEAKNTSLKNDNNELKIKLESFVEIQGPVFVLKK